MSVKSDKKLRGQRALSKRDMPEIKHPYFSLLFNNIRGGGVEKIANCVQSNFKDFDIICLCETHINADKSALLADKLPKYLIRHCLGTERAKGISVFVKREILENGGDKEEDFITKDIIENDAMSCDIKTKYGKTSGIILHAPNEGRKKSEFFSALREVNLDRVSWIVGDFNSVENTVMDRNTGKDANDIEWLGDWAKENLMIDGWRDENPLKKEFTFLQVSSKHQSRIDRIYVKADVLDQFTNWTINSVDYFDSDHVPIEVRWTPKESPQVRNERIERIHPKIIKNDKINELIVNLFNKTQDIKLSEWIGLKQSIREEYKSLYFEMKVSWTRDRKELVTRVRQAQKRLYEGCKPLRSTIYKTALEALTLYDEKSKESKEAWTKYKWFSEGEKNTKYFSNVLNPPPAKVPIKRLKDKEGEWRESEHVPEIAREFYQSLYTDESPCEESQDIMLGCLKNRLSNEECSNVNSPIRLSEVLEAIKQAKTCKAPGHDGIPIEFYKKFIENVGRVLTEVFNKIILGDVDEGMISFTKGIITILPKVKDPESMKQFRPITLLNCDYKIFTKVLSNRLMVFMNRIIGPEQKGFIKGRKIGDAILNVNALRRLAIKEPEAFGDKIEECNLVFWDQEKAYDRVDHSWLFKVLAKLNLPITFIETVERLYKHATSQITVNGAMSQDVKIRRGVRQGDPLSCVLYVCSIEPLAAKLQELSGVKATLGEGEVTYKCDLFADDLVTLLKGPGDYAHVLQSLETYGRASNARVNKDKCVSLQISTEESETDYLDELPKFKKGGETLKYLGYDLDDDDCCQKQWEIIIKKIAKAAGRWGQMRFSLKGRVLIANSHLLAYAGYFLQHLPVASRTLAVIERMIFSFLWCDKKRGPTSREVCYLPQSVGGLGVISIHDMNTALKANWFKELLKGPPSQNNSLSRGQAWQTTEFWKLATHKLAYTAAKAAKINKKGNLKLVCEDPMILWLQNIHWSKGMLDPFTTQVVKSWEELSTGMEKTAELIPPEWRGNFPLCLNQSIPELYSTGQSVEELAELHSSGVNTLWKLKVERDKIVQGRKDATFGSLKHKSAKKIKRDALVMNLGNKLREHLDVLQESSETALPPEQTTQQTAQQAEANADAESERSVVYKPTTLTILSACDGQLRLNNLSVSNARLALLYNRSKNDVVPNPKAEDPCSPIAKVREVAKLTLEEFGKTLAKLKGIKQVLYKICGLRNDFIESSWKMSIKSLPVGSIVKHWSGSGTCPFCPAVETLEHLFVGCQRAKVVWQTASSLSLRYTSNTFHYLVEEEENVLLDTEQTIRKLKMMEESEKLLWIYATTIGILWSSRNAMLKDQKDTRPSETLTNFYLARERFMQVVAFKVAPRRRKSRKISKKTESNTRYYTEASDQAEGITPERWEKLEGLTVMEGFLSSSWFSPFELKPPDKEAKVGPHVNHE